MALTITDANFQDQVADQDKLVIMDFWATWCQPCRAIAPIIDQLHEELDGKAIVGKVNIEENSELPVKYKVRGIPTVVFVKNGEEVGRQVGLASKAAFDQKIAALL